MPQPSPRPAPRSSGGERVFTDDVARLRNASTEGARGGTPVPACAGDTRHAARAVALDAGARLADLADEARRGRLRDAARIGRPVGRLM